MALRIVNRGKALDSSRRQPTRREGRAEAGGQRLLLLHPGVAAVLPRPGVLVPMPGVHPRMLPSVFAQEPA